MHLPVSQQLFLPLRFSERYVCITEAA